jgi:hypothetical protein
MQVVQAYVMDSTSTPLPFMLGLEVGAFMLVILIFVHRTLVFLTPKGRRLDRPLTPLPPVASVKVWIESWRLIKNNKQRNQKIYFY